MKYRQNLFDDRIELLETYEAETDYRWDNPRKKARRCCGLTKEDCCILFFLKVFNFLVIPASVGLLFFCLIEGFKKNVGEDRDESIKKYLDLIL